MMTLEAFVMVALASAAVLVAYTKLKCPQTAEDHRIAWLPTAADEPALDEDANLLTFRR